MFKGKQAKLAVEKLAEELGFGKPTYYHGLQSVEFWDKNKKFVTIEEFKRLLNQLGYEFNSGYIFQKIGSSYVEAKDIDVLYEVRKDLKILIDYLGLEIFEGKELRKKKKS